MENLFSVYNLEDHKEIFLRLRTINVKKTSGVQDGLNWTLVYKQAPLFELATFTRPVTKLAAKSLRSLSSASFLPSLFSCL